MLFIAIFKLSLVEIKKKIKTFNSKTQKNE